MGERNPEGDSLDGAHDALNRMKRAHKRGTGCHLTSAMIDSLYVTIIGQAWGQDDPRAALAEGEVKT